MSSLSLIFHLFKLDPLVQIDMLIADPTLCLPLHQGKVMSEASRFYSDELADFMDQPLVLSQKLWAVVNLFLETAVSAHEDTILWVEKDTEWPADDLL